VSDGAFPSLSSTEEALLRSLIREEVANGIADVSCTNGCARMRLTLAGLGVLYTAIVGVVIGNLV